MARQVYAATKLNREQVEDRNSELNEAAERICMTGTSYWGLRPSLQFGIRFGLNCRGANWREERSVLAIRKVPRRLASPKSSGMELAAFGERPIPFLPRMVRISTVLKPEAKDYLSGKCRYPNSF